MRILTRERWMVIWGLMTVAVVITASMVGAHPELVQSATACTTVTIQGFQFNPDTLSVKRGSKVIFSNQDDTPHTVTPENKAAFTGSGRLQKNDSKPIVFTQVGEQDYFCEIHPSMKGKIIVTN